MDENQFQELESELIVHVQGLLSGLDQRLTYHNADHTGLEVGPAAILIAESMHLYLEKMALARASVKMGLARHCLRNLAFNNMGLLMN